MDLHDRLTELSNRIAKQKSNSMTEEATKTAFVLPFLQALGYDVFNPTEVVPEFTADHGVKKGEKVDYAIRKDGEITIIIECKPIGAPLQAKYAGQLFRYFGVTDAKFGVLTDGIKYLFFSDLDKENKMDERPFLEFNVLEFDQDRVEQLKKFSKAVFDVDSIVETASDLKYNKALLEEIGKEFQTPSDEMVRLLAGRVYEGRFSAQTRERFAELVANAMAEFVRTKINERLKSALESGTVEPKASKAPVASPVVEVDDGIETTPEEIESHMIIRVIASELVEPARVVMRDAKSYCAILFDDNNRKTIARLYYSNRKMSVGLFAGKEETRHEIQSVMDLYGLRTAICTAVGQFIESAPRDPKTQTEALAEAQKSDSEAVSNDYGSNAHI